MSGLPRGLRLGVSGMRGLLRCNSGLPGRLTQVCPGYMEG